MKQEQERKLIYYGGLLLGGIALTVGIYLILTFSWELLTL